MKNAVGRDIPDFLLSGGKEEKIIFHGKGRGTGLGLSAWGARGMVVNNEKITASQILQHYYPGTHLVKGQ